MSPKKCVFGCEDKLTLFNFPRDAALAARWTQLLLPLRSRGGSRGNRRGGNRGNHVFVCSRHFSDDCFTNKAQFEAGFAARLHLRPGALPAASGQDSGEEEETKPKVSSGRVVVVGHDGHGGHDGPRLKHAASQTEPLANTVSVATQFCQLRKSVGTQFSSAAGTRSAATQLSLFVLKPHVRSKATQVTLSPAPAGPRPRPPSSGEEPEEPKPRPPSPEEPKPRPPSPEEPKPRPPSREESKLRPPSSGEEPEERAPPKRRRVQQEEQEVGTSDP